MAMRVTGMYSGLDTESIIQELVSAKQTKVDTAKKEQTTIKWQQEAWSSLNTKLKNLQTQYVDVMRYSSAYTKLATTVSNSSAVSVVTGANAVVGVQSLEISQLAKSGYLTGAKIGGNDGSELTALSKLSDIAGAEELTGEGTFTVKTGNTSVDIKVNGDTTISDVLTQIKSAGLNASFDAKQQRFFISSKESGAANDFSITASDSNGAKALAALGIQTDLTQDKATMAEYAEYAGYYVAGDDEATLANMQGMIDKDVASKVNSYLEQYKSLTTSIETAQSKIDEIQAKYGDTALESAEYYKEAIESKNSAIEEKEAEIAAMSDDDPDKAAAEEELAALKEEVTALQERQTDAETIQTQQNNITKYNEQLNDVTSNITVTDNGDGTYSAEATDALRTEVETGYYNKAEYAYNVVNNNIALPESGATKISGQDAVIRLNGAEFTSNNNVFEINGLTFTALAETKEGESISVTTAQDTDGIYDMIKNFLTAYNEIVNEMDKLYNADSAKGYEPLTSEEKEAMTESEIEEWEQKIKDALLRRDDNLNTVNSALQNIMSSGIEVNGKTMYLFDFGIDTLGYFSSADNEKHAYHIDGDPDDANTKNNSDVLRSMILNDPDTVVSFFSKLSSNLYNKMFDLSKSVDGYRTFGNFYDDKKLQSDYDEYTTKITELEEALTEYEDKWYSKFSAMETALAKMQSSANAVTSLLGG